MRTTRVEVLTYGGVVSGARAGTRRAGAREGLLLRVATADGRLGQGEASPLPGYSRDTIDEAREALSLVDWAMLPEPDASIEGVRRALEEIGIVFGGAPASALFAVETAWLDLLGQRRGLPIWRLLTDREDARLPVPLSTFIGGADDDGIVDSARRCAARGAHTVKVKITGPVLGAQLDALSRVRDVLGDGRLRLDANRSLDPTTALIEIERLGSVCPEFLEEPVPTGALAGLGAPSVALALDESLQDDAAWRGLSPHLERLRCVAVVLKPTALGGISCLRLATAASERGLDVTVSHAFDGPVALAACAHLAIAVGSRGRASGLDRHAGLQAWPEMDALRNGLTNLVATDHPGLGVAPLPSPS